MGRNAWSVFLEIGKRFAGPLKRPANRNLSARPSDELLFGRHVFLPQGKETDRAKRHYSGECVDAGAGSRDVFIRGKPVIIDVPS